MNVTVSQGVCAVVPGLAMGFAHFFPWRKLLRRDLHRLEAYSIGTTAIVGTATAAMLATDSARGRDHAAQLMLAAGSAGVVTLLAWALDAFLQLRGEVARERAYTEAIHDLRSESV